MSKEKLTKKQEIHKKAQDIVDEINFLNNCNYHIDPFIFDISILLKEVIDLIPDDQEQDKD